MPRAPKTPTATTPTVPRPRLVRKARGTQSTPPAAVPHELIALHAYWLFLARGCVHGHDLDDWLAAERELLESQAAVAQARRAG